MPRWLAGNRGSLDLITAQLAPRLGRRWPTWPVRHAACSMTASTPFRPRWGSARLSDPLQPGGGQGDFFAGIALLPGSEARRQLGDAPPEGIELLRRVAERRHFRRSCWIGPNATRRRPPGCWPRRPT